MALISNGTTIFDAGAMASGFGGSLSFIKKLTASSSSTIEFVDGSSNVVLDNTFKEYVFFYIAVHPATNEVNFQVNFSTDGGSNYNVTKTSTAFAANLYEDGSGASLFYWGSRDRAQSTSAQYLGSAIGNGGDECASGYLHLYNPSDTTFVKHFQARANSYHASNLTVDQSVGGYLNTTSAVDAVEFSMSSGNIDSGDILLFGVK